MWFPLSWKRSEIASAKSRNLHEMLFSFLFLIMQNPEVLNERHVEFRHVLK